MDHAVIAMVKGTSKTQAFGAISVETKFDSTQSQSVGQKPLAPPRDRERGPLLALRLVGGALILCGLGLALHTARQPLSYVGCAQLRVYAPNEHLPNWQEMECKAMVSEQTLSLVVQEQRLVQEWRLRGEIEAVECLREMVAVVPEPNTEIFAIRVSSEEPKEAARAEAELDRIATSLEAQDQLAEQKRLKVLKLARECQIFDIGQLDASFSINESDEKDGPEPIYLRAMEKLEQLTQKNRLSVEKFRRLKAATGDQLLEVLRDTDLEGPNLVEFLPSCRPSDTSLARARKRGPRDKGERAGPIGRGTRKAPLEEPTQSKLLRELPR